MSKFALIATAALCCAFAATAAQSAPRKSAPKGKVSTKLSTKAAVAGTAAAAGVVVARAGTESRGLSAGQMDAAERVMLGAATCDDNATVSLSPVSGQPGHFKLDFNGTSYTVVPEETTTGAVRLEDRKAGIVWLQIPAKSMLMSAKLGRRLVDGCQMSQQRAGA